MWATGARAPAAACAPARVEFVSPKTSTQSGRSASIVTVIPGRITAGSAERVASRWRGSSRPSSSKKTCDSSGS